MLFRSGVNRLVYLNSYQQYGILAGNRFLLGDRDTEQGGASGSKRTVYAISNQGTKTVFKEGGAEAGPPVSIRQFDEFQEGLLRNYSFYCESVRKDRGLAAHRLGP